MGKGRPEFYDEKEAAKYRTSRQMKKVQRQLTVRSVELLKIPPDVGPLLMLDVGCGSGLSGRVLEKAGHHWIGVDVAEAMLQAGVDRGAEGDGLRWDMGFGLPFRPAVFDGCISISALQWLCDAYESGHVQKRRLKAFFTSLFRVLKRGARAVLQFYPENAAQGHMITECATAAGFGGGLLTDWPHGSRSKKHYLVLMVGTTGDVEEEDEEASRKRKRAKRKEGPRGKKGRPAFKSPDWVKLKKAQRRLRGQKVAKDSRYTGRKRPMRF